MTMFRKLRPAVLAVFLLFLVPSQAGPRSPEKPAGASPKKASKVLRRNGGSSKTERAVRAALEWLLRHQSRRCCLARDEACRP